MCTDRNCKIEASILALVVVCGRKKFVGMNDFQVYGAHYKIAPRKMDSGMEEEFLHCILGISSN